MVAPTRAPQARGLKCDLCKKILAQATWLDQTKLAKSIADAQQVILLIQQHDLSECPCIPNSIKNLLVGSTHFEIHRLAAKNLDGLVFKCQYDNCMDAIQRATKEMANKRPYDSINDCNDSDRSSRFKIYPNHSDHKNFELSSQLVKHLCLSIDYWKTAMEDQSDTFNSKLALRLGLTHHVIYACYLFKYYKILDYQLLAANLLLNLFSSIEGVTTNAIQHANYLLIKTLIDCDQYHLAKQYLKQATRCPAYQNKSHYESILVTCISCELSLLETTDTYNLFDELAELAVIKPDDKLQHYYARTLALSIIIKYIHCFKARSDLCFEFHHTFRYVSAIIRRCFENTFELIMAEKDKKNQQPSKQSQVIDHSWIRFAVCDFAFNTLEMLCKFYIRCGMPETLQLLYNGMNMIAYRTGSCYWQANMAALGSCLDILCARYDEAKTKLDVMSRIIGHTNNTHIMNMLRLNLEVSTLRLIHSRGGQVKEAVLLDLLQRTKTCQMSLIARTSQLELYDCKSNSYLKISDSVSQYVSDLLILGGCLGQIGLESFKLAIESAMLVGDKSQARDFMAKLGSQIDSRDCKVIEYNLYQTVLESILALSNVNNSVQILLDAVRSSRLFLGHQDTSLESKLSSLNINDDQDETKTKNRPAKTRQCKVNRLNLKKPTIRKRNYEVTTPQDISIARQFDAIEAVKIISDLTDEELVVCYLRNSEPNPDFLLYRKAHELMFSYRLKDCRVNHDELLYHFCESNSSNTMRYRWMMFEEQQFSPFDCPSANKCNISGLRNLGFSSTLVNTDKTVKSMLKLVPHDYRFLQLKYLIDERSQEEYLVMCSFDGRQNPVYASVKRSIKSVSLDESIEVVKSTNGTSDVLFSLPNKFLSKLEQAKKTLFFKNHRSRTEARQKLEKDLGLILHELENDWMGPMRFLLYGPLQDEDSLGYDQWVDCIIADIKTIMVNHTCNSLVGLRLMVENGPLLSREEFRSVLATLFDCSISDQEVRDCFNKWYNSLETFLAKLDHNINKSTFMQKLRRGQIGLILDRELEFLPFESLPVVRVFKQPFFRVPSLRIYSIICHRNGSSSVLKVNSDETVYMLDPANNLGKTRARFEDRLKLQKTWLGSIGREPTNLQMEQWFTEKQIYLFIGHGAGTAYYNRLCKGRGLGAMSLVRPVSIVMGCSSGRVLSEGSNLETFGIGWVFVFRGSPSYVGLLWDVTDTDIDRFLDSLLERWMQSRWICSEESTTNNTATEKSNTYLLTDAVAQARQVCQYKNLVGSTPIIYGIPVMVCPDKQ